VRWIVGSPVWVIHGPPVSVSASMVSLWMYATRFAIQFLYCCLVSGQMSLPSVVPKTAAGIESMRALIVSGENSFAIRSSMFWTKIGAKALSRRTRRGAGTLVRQIE